MDLQPIKTFLTITLFFLLLGLVNNSQVLTLLWLYIFIWIYFKCFIKNQNKSFIKFLCRRTLYIFFMVLPIIFIKNNICHFIKIPDNIILLLIAILIPIIWQFFKMRDQNILILGKFLYLSSSAKPRIFIVNSLFLFSNSIAEEIFFRIILFYFSSNLVVAVITSYIIFCVVHNMDYFRKKTSKIQNLFDYLIWTSFFWSLFIFSHTFTYGIIAHLCFNLPNILIAILASWYAFKAKLN